MRTYTLKLTSWLILTALLITACRSDPLQPAAAPTSTPGALSQPTSTTVTAPTPVPGLSTGGSNGPVAAYEGTLENVYALVNPSVVNIQSIQSQGTVSQILASGFVWDNNGDIVTNDHVVEGADKIEVTFSDGSTFLARLIGVDSYSDLAVLRVTGAGDKLHPAQLADSKQAKVGELAIAIGNPYGLVGTMTVGVISALSRSLPVGDGNSNGPEFTIPDIIQTDAPINPGNSGGVLTNEKGQVIGVTTAIESSTQANTGIGFAIPSSILSRVIPALITTGKYDHPYLGISGTDLTLDLAQAMNLSNSQRGVLVVTVATDGPAAKAGIQPSQDTAIVNGQNVPVGGDVITAINGQTVNMIDDLIAYLNDNCQVGQTVKLTILRNNTQISQDVTLTARPASIAIPQATPTPPLPGNGSYSNTWLGILGAQLTPEVAKAMDLNVDQQGILIVLVEGSSPADQAQLRGSDRGVTLEGQTVMIGGDVITSVDGKPVVTLDDLRTLISSYQPGTVITLTIIRDGNTLEVPVTLAAKPASVP